MRTLVQDFYAHVAEKAVSYKAAGIKFGKQIKPTRLQGESRWHNAPSCGKVKGMTKPKFENCGICFQPTVRFFRSSEQIVDTTSDRGGGQGSSKATYR